MDHGEKEGWRSYNVGPQDLSGRGEEATHLPIWRLTFHISLVFIFFLRLKASDKLPVCFQHIDNYTALRSTVCCLRARVPAHRP